MPATYSSAPFKAFTIACISALAHLVRADQPVHCLKSQIAGYWTFQVSSEATKADLATADTVCTHELPNKLQIVKPELEFALPGQKSELNLLLQADYSVKVLDSARGQWTGEVGTWTNVYDQAIVVDLPQTHKAKYTANLRYSLKPSVRPDQYDQMKCGSYEYFDSRCSETMVGVKYNANKMVQCWIGYQVEPLIDQSSKPAQTESASPFVLAQTASQVDEDDELAQVSSSTQTNKKLGSFSEMPEEERIQLAQSINEAGLSWHADPYLSEAVVSSGELNLAQIDSESYNYSRMRQQFGENTKEFHDAVAQAQQFLGRNLKDISVEELPESWDWQNVNGFDFTGRHMDQKHCGSCYLLATNSMLESRIKIWYGKDVPLSAQQRLDCNYINEGCHGGWGYFDGLFLEQYGAVEASCATYQATSVPEGCGKWANCRTVAGVKDTYYVGSRHYGGMSEQDMMKELRAHGPILFDFNAGREFQAYKGGILSEDRPVSQSFQHQQQLYSTTWNGLRQMASSTTTQEEQGLQWSKLTHSTLIVGYGVEEDPIHGTIKYWIVRNSYGETWGEHGNLRVRRGRNDYGCESESIAITPLLY